MIQMYRKKLTELLSCEYNCRPEDFSQEKNILTVSVNHPQARVYNREPAFLRIVTTGRNAVVTADPVIHPFLEGFIHAENAEGHWLLTVPNLLRIESELNRHGYTLTQTHHMFLPDRRTEPVRARNIRWFYGNEIRPFYGDPRFPNAICPQYEPERPDRMIVCSYTENGEITGMAGCSEDAPHWQQIGIDVLPQFRSAGLGTDLVTMLKNKIIERGDIPFYGTAMSNLHSQNIAKNAGFRPAWTEIGAKPSPAKAAKP